MRTKMRGGKARFSRSPCPIPPATRSFPFINLNTNEVYGECSIDRTVEMPSEEKDDGGRRIQKQSDVWAKKLVEVDSSLELMEMDSFETKTCIVCQKGGDDVQVCSGTNCLVAIHKKCLKARPPELDEIENFYCPSCLYNRALLWQLEQRKKAMAAKKSLLIFLSSKDDDVRMSEGSDRGKESDVLANAGERNESDCDDRNRMVTNQVEKHFVPVESEQQNDEDNSKQADNVKLKQGREEEPMLSEASGAETSGSDSETIAMRLRHRLDKGKEKVKEKETVVLSPKGADRKKKTRSPNVKATPSKKSRKQQASSSNFSNLKFANEKRKRRHWTTEEEETLREAVHKFSTTVNKNLPWRKILDFGHHVFDSSRNPTDLKDKWRNMMARESPSKGKR